MKLRDGVFLAAALIASAGCASAPLEESVDEGAKKILDQHERTGVKTACLSLAQISSIRPVTETTFLVRVRSGDYYVNDVSGRCNGATRNSTRLEYTTSTGQLCQNEIIRVVDNTTGAQWGGCGLGAYEKLKKKPQQDEEG